MRSLPQKIFITLDTDWCPAEVLQYALDQLRQRELRCTIFATGAYAALTNAATEHYEIGLHPNFNQVTLAQYESTLRELLALYPHAQGVASHAMMSSTPLLHLFRQAGLRYDRNLLFYQHKQARPFYYFNGLLRVPIFWEDDIWFGQEPRAPFAADLFARDDLPLVFNFHPIHLFLNTASPEHYAAFKPHYHNPRALQKLRHPGYGTFSFFSALTAHLREQKIATGLLRELVAP